jgi:hypothetical protein
MSKQIFFFSSYSLSLSLSLSEFSDPQAEGDFEPSSRRYQVYVLHNVSFHNTHRPSILNWKPNPKHLIWMPQWLPISRAYLCATETLAISNLEPYTISRYSRIPSSGIGLMPTSSAANFSFFKLVSSFINGNARTSLIL